MMKSGCEKKFTSILFIILVLCIILSCSEIEIDEDQTIIKDYIVCKQCGTDVALSNFLLNKKSPLALSAKNETLFETQVLVQEFESQLGLRYRVIILKRAACSKVKTWTTTNTWFPDYAWKVCFCPKCSVHIGWMYEPIKTATSTQSYPSENGFYIIIANYVISENYVNSLLMTEKTYREN